MTDTPAAPTTPVPTRLLEVVGKTLYGWGDDEPNEATGYTAVYESAKVAAAIHEAGYRLPARSTPAEARASAPLDVERLADVLTQDFGPSYFPGQHDVTIFGRTPREVAEKIASRYAARLTTTDEGAGEFPSLSEGRTRSDWRKHGKDEPR